MRKTVKMAAGWMHATLILAIILPLLYSIGVRKGSVSGQALYVRSLLIALPVVLTDIAERKCKGLPAYLAVCVLTFGGTVALGRRAAGTLPEAEALGYLLVLAAGTLFVTIDRIMVRMDRYKGMEAGDDPTWKPYKDVLKEPVFPALGFFFVVYAIALNVDAPGVCNAALGSAAIYGVCALLYHYVDGTESYLSLNKRTCNLPSKRIYGIGNGMLALFLLLLMVAALPSFLTVSKRQYRDVREGSVDWDLVFYRAGQGAGGMESADASQPGWREALGEPQPAPRWMNALFYLTGAVVCFFCAIALGKAMVDMFRMFREAKDENGDIVEELKDGEGEEGKRGEEKRRMFRTRRRSLSERERIRKQYRKVIRKHRKERPGVYESPLEIEVKAGIAQSEEGKELHGRYEYARYGRGME